MSLYSIDTSAWHHSTNPGVAARWHEFLETDALGVCDQVRLEILWSARSARDYDSVAQELGALHAIPTDEATFRRALFVQRELAGVGGLHHRSVKIADLVIAAASEAAGAVLLHYDVDYERIAMISGQPVEWIAPKGSL